MSAANFKSMDLFPLVVTKTPYCKVCPECGEIHGEDEKICTSCNTDISDVEAVYDEMEAEDQAEAMEYAASNINKELTFFRVSVESGYYSGLQFYVEYDNDGGDPADLTNADTWYYYDMNRSTAIRKHTAEINRINRELRAMVKTLGLTEIRAAARFSNGEVWYTKVG